MTLTMKGNLSWMTVALTVLGTGCGGLESENRSLAATSPNAAATSGTSSLPTLNTYIGDGVFIQIDADANLSLGNDLADGTASNDSPPGATKGYIDWNEIIGMAHPDSTGTPFTVSDIQIVDRPDGGSDGTAFPGSNSCVGPANVLDKMNINYIMAASNDTYAFFAVQRAGNSGDAGWYWLLTQSEPNMPAGGGPCKSSQKHLTYNLTAKDILLVGHFQGGTGTPLVRVYRAVPGLNGSVAYDAIQATNFGNTALWAPYQPGTCGATTTACAFDSDCGSGVTCNLPAGTKIFSSVNQTPTDPGRFGSAGVKNMVGNALDVNLFAEAAIPLSIMGGAGCGAAPKYFGTVVTRSSGSGGTSPDLKDLAGPASFTFGKPTAAGTLVPTCLSRSFQYYAIAGATQCEWTFTNDATGHSYTSTECGTAASPKTFTASEDGIYSAALTVTTNSCSSDKASVGSVPAYQPLSATARVTGTCSNSVNYSAGSSGGSGNVTYQWTGLSSTTISGQSGTTSLAKGFYTGTVTATDSATGCTASAYQTTNVYDPLKVTLAVNSSPTTCSNLPQFTATANGTGSGAFSWVFSGCTGGPTACTATDPGNICGDPAVTVTLTDTVCNSSATDTMYLHKRITYSANRDSQNP